MQTKDSEIARLSDIVAGLAQQMASLAVNQAKSNRAGLRIKQSERRARAKDKDIGLHSEDPPSEDKEDPPSDGGYAGDEEALSNQSNEKPEDQVDTREKVTVTPKPRQSIHNRTPKFLLTREYRQYLEHIEAAYN
ncbi:hypothetical protein EYR36_004935 [Pleurotus pulmonarius]|nr:hypothetical protein EYR36_004935 [Pleurotus pulmonarius]